MSPLPRETDEEDESDSDADLKEFIPTIALPVKTALKDVEAEDSSDESAAAASLVSPSMTALLLPEISRMECSEDGGYEHSSHKSGKNQKEKYFSMVRESQGIFIIVNIIKVGKSAIY